MKKNSPVYLQCLLQIQNSILNGTAISVVIISYRGIQHTLILAFLLVSIHQFNLSSSRFIPRHLGVSTLFEGHTFSLLLLTVSGNLNHPLSSNEAADSQVFSVRRFMLHSSNPCASFPVCMYLDFLVTFYTGYNLKDVRIRRISKQRLHRKMQCLLKILVDI